MAFIQVEFLTDDQKMRELCAAYWQTDDEGKFVHKVTDLAEPLNLRPHELTKVVRKHCRAFRPERLCKTCSKPSRYLECRSDLVYYTGRERFTFCEDCEAEARRQRVAEAELYAEALRQQEQSRKEEQERWRKQQQELADMRTHRLAEDLTLIEFNFLVALADSRDVSRARKQAGLSKQEAINVIEKFNKLDLIHYTVAVQGHGVLFEVNQTLRKIGLQRQVHSIFASPKVLELYRKLSRQYIFVFPNVALSDFIVEAHAARHFTEEWHVPYFRTAKVDFAACDLEGKPIFAVDYHEGSRRSSDELEQSKFKKMILNEVGVSLREVTGQELENLDI
jgi:hypothetical protein